MWYSAHFPFNRDSDTAFDFLRCLTDNLRDDLHLYILNIGKSLDRQFDKGVHTGYQQRPHHNENEQPLLD